MPTLLQINVTANWGSTGRIAEDIGKIALEKGWRSVIAYGRGKPKSASELIRIGSDWDIKMHGLQSRLLDNHGLASRKATERFIEKAEELKPDIVHLHNIHGYYLHYPTLFEWLARVEVPVVWTLHDCWSFTGHCAYFDYVQCDRWKRGCHHCLALKQYPASLMIDRSERNYENKRKAFTSVRNMTFVPVSAWLDGLLKHSFLGSYPSVVIHNGIDINTFKPAEGARERVDMAYHTEGKHLLLGVASIWDRRKGLSEFIKLRQTLDDKYSIVLVGLDAKQVKQLPDGIIGITRTENVAALVDLYTAADVFVNPTLEDNFPTTNLEAMACGTPVVTYHTGGSPEAIDKTTGAVVGRGDVDGLCRSIAAACKGINADVSSACRHRAEAFYDNQKNFKQYIKLYHNILQTQS